MGYRTYIGKISKEEHDRIKNMSHNDLLDHYHGEYTESESVYDDEKGYTRTTITHFRKIKQGDEYGGQVGEMIEGVEKTTELIFHEYNEFASPKNDNRCISNHDIVEELHEFGKYVEFGNKKFYSPFFSNEETQKGFTEEYDFWIVEKEYLKHIIEFYKQKVVNYYNEMLNPFFGADVEFSEFMDSIRHSYDGGNKNYTFDFTKITQEQQTQLFEILHHMRSMRSEWTLLIPYNLEKGDHITDSWKYEYNIFELVRIYKTFDWENDIMVYYGY